MLNIEKTRENDKLTITLSGRLDSVTSPELEECLDHALEDVTDLTLDFEELEYISSAGLRVVLTTQKKMNRQGSMTVRRVNETIMEIFEVTGFVDILTIE